MSKDKLNPLTLPLYGQRLIEASAGTGKTYTIGVLYLRLLLGLGGSAAFSRPLNVEEILVVTFTEAATDELRGRIRENIHQLRLACIREETVVSDPLYQQLLNEIPDKASAASWLLVAERQMDEAAIYTIHGFCQRMLVHNAFESGVLFDQTLIQDESQLRKQGCADFWRRHCYPLPLPIAAEISRIWRGPEALLKDISDYLHGDMPYIVNAPDSDETLFSRHQKIIEQIESLKGQWNDAAAELEELIANSGVDKRSYSKKYLPDWLRRVSQWAKSPTEDYLLPKELDKFCQSRLSEKTKKGEAPRHPLFEAIDGLYQQPLTLKDIIITKAIVEVRQSVNQEKLIRGYMGFDDLLTRLDSALQRAGGEQLAATIRQRYPVAMIDEFQDTDPQQYRIFQAIYRHSSSENGLLFIGDPKQAIYAFRGADIFTYIRARSNVKAHYTLETNWRSSASMVQAVNTLFARPKHPFLFEQIPFIHVNATEKNHGLKFSLHGEDQTALRFWLQPGEGVSKGEYEQHMARQCAAQIRDWLQAGQEGKALLYQAKDKQRPVMAADITVLVRNRREASLIRKELNTLKIPSVYLSNRESVFDTPEAKDLLWLLQAVLAPEKARELRSALASSLFGLNAQQIDQLNHDETAWDRLVDEFDGYARLWRTRGVLPMLRAVMVKYRIAENLLAGDDGERRLTDVMHMSELLQEISQQLDSEHAVVRWLGQQISRPDPQSENQQLRLESDRHLVQICTIHKSKGLEYPLVCLPFICGYRKQKHAVYHDRHHFEAHLNISHDDETLKEALELADEERLAEDLRLLYVALTRSVYHCSVGVAPLIKGNRGKAGDTDLHLSALGYLLQKGQQGDAALLVNSLKALADDSVDNSIEIKQAEETTDSQWRAQGENILSLEARKLRRFVRDEWRVTSYSGLQHSASHVTSPAYAGALGESVEVIVQSISPKLDIDARGEKREEQALQMTPHTFPRGASAGTFLHSLLEDRDFAHPPDPAWLAEKLTASGFDENWAPVLAQWMEDILCAPLNEQGMQLARVPRHLQQSEMQFYLPVDKLLHAKEMDKLIRRYDPLSAQCAPLSFHQVKGMLKGFIDLVFCWQEKFYVVDYKSNWLGENSRSYTQEAMVNAMIEHRYDFQYQLYTLALHRYLRHRLAHYDYRQHFGGVIYLFLRGIDKDNPGHGIYHYLPPFEFIDELDRLFSAATEE
ncbi:exodeoxyribonuclease V subunit beta [Xenorhabdus sp. PR6a]|uniref:exodeoxyribonuclease V subunit beta n=1 Tax=Xenorhabdus sp. PR6a TaxID=3025877 RepID=UPI0023591252|nr:exodeoxyribonuclease V subunit beta [Xenorhabdus sp. PR6a]MDC9580052.1 exodeoxyribonuclease V subunit beta [Xenorhabdus sp. PR6a]